MKGTDVLLAKGTSHTRMKETLAKTTTSASSDVEKSLKKMMMDKSTICPLSFSKSRDVF